MKIKQIASALVVTALALTFGCNRDRDREHKEAPIGVSGTPVSSGISASGLNFAINDQGYATVQVTPGEKITWTGAPNILKFQVQFLHNTAPCLDTSNTPVDLLESQVVPGARVATAVCTLASGYSTLMYQIRIVADGHPDWATDCRGCNLNLLGNGGSSSSSTTSGGASSGPSGSSSPASSGATPAATSKVVHNFKPPTARNSSNPGIPFYCESGKTAFTYSSTETVSVNDGDLPGIRTWFGDGIAMPWTVNFAKDSPCTEGKMITGPPASGASNFVCTIPKGAKEGKYHYLLMVPGCSAAAIKGTVVTTKHAPPAIE